ncbi:MAG: two-component system sensor histidine kinase NtrB [Planctomycetota bacterium]|jgi:PAS domain S-box-containing protein
MPSLPLDTVLQGELAVRIFEESNDAFIIFNPQTATVIEVNATTQRLTGQRRKQLIDRHITEIVSSEHDEDLKSLLSEMSETGYFQVRDGYFLHSATRPQVPVSITVSRLHVGPETLALVIARDMSRQRRLQQELREVERQLEQNRHLVSLGELVATLAHEIRQPLCAITNFSCVAETRLELGEYDKAAEALQRISEESLRSSEVVSQIQSFVRSQEPRTADVDINSLVKETLTYLAPETSHGAISVTTQLETGLPKGVCNALQLQEVIINLVRNALEACGGAGVDEPRIVITTEQSAACITIAVADNGPGVSDTMRNRLFKPFETSRDDGMGMGLAICRRMMTAICGRLELRETSPAGATFVISVPTVGQPANGTSS